jgi:hypothetical protein
MYILQLNKGSGRCVEVGGCLLSFVVGSAGYDDDFAGVLVFVLDVAVVVLDVALLL